jgi:excisionase family DNA binding protein
MENTQGDRMRRNLTLKTAAYLLGSSTRTVYRLISDGELSAFKVRGGLRIPEESLEEYQRRQILKYAEENGISVSGCDRV